MSETMIVACPQCGTRFVAPAEPFRPHGRKVRCATCRHAWFQTPQDAGEDPAHAAAEPAPRPRKRTKPKPRQSAGNRRTRPRAGEARPSSPAPRRSGGFWRWLLFGLAALMLLAIAAYIARDALSARFPALAPALTAYEARVQGVRSALMSPGSSLKIENVVYDFAGDGAERALLVSADVVNHGAEAAPAPALVVRAYDQSGAALLETMTPAPSDGPLDPGARRNYLMSAPEPEGGVARIVVDFVKER